MKIRSSHVSNSSSSSFVIIGTENSHLVEKAMEVFKADWADSSYGELEITKKDNEKLEYMVQFNGYNYEPSYFGVHAPNLLVTMNLPQAVEFAEKYLSELIGEDFSGKVGFEYGECGG